MQSLTIDIVSDIACPWCAIGYARLERALTTLKGEIEGQVEWHAFELNRIQTSSPCPSSRHCRANTAAAKLKCGRRRTT
ncbi:DsbA family protein [Halopseudomonas pachastrellae]|nr:DsbA family protein [Halopseudomonas pachastrellae]